MQDITRVVALHHNEWVLVKFRQSYLSSISPDTVVLTNKRIIIIHNSFWGLYAGINLIEPTRVISVNLGSVAGSTSTDGKILASVHVRIRGSAEESNAPRTGLHIDGLRIAGANRLTSMLDDLISSKSSEVMEVGQSTAAAMIKGGKAKLIWLGAETPDYVGYLLKVDPASIIKINPVDIASMSADGLRAFDGYILVCYSGDLSTEIAYMLRNEYDIKTMVLKGGIASLVGSEKKGKGNKSQLEE